MPLNQYWLFTCRQEESISGELEATDCVSMPLWQTLNHKLRLLRALIRHEVVQEVDLAGFISNCDSLTVMGNGQTGDFALSWECFEGLMLAQTLHHDILAECINQFVVGDRHFGHQEWDWFYLCDPGRELECLCIKNQEASGCLLVDDQPRVVLVKNAMTNFRFCILKFEISMI